MERLTKRLDDGQAVMRCAECKESWNKEHGAALEGCTALYCRNRCKERLAAYEDTGLMPEEFKAYWAFFEDLIGNQKANEALFFYRHLITAYKDGYAAVLSFKVGEIAWMWNEDFGTVLPYTVDLISVISDGIVSYSANCNHNGELLDSIDFDDEDIGKTIFHAQVEAEKALEGMKND